MATIYRFIVEQQEGKGSSGRKSTNSSGGISKTRKSSKDRTFTLMGTMGVEHNRKLRAINPLMNKATGGYWEKGMRLGRAGLGLVKFKATEAGGLAFAGISWVAIAIIISYVIQTTMKYHNKQIQENEKVNKQNYRKLETGQNAIHGAFEVSTNWWSGKRSYNENK